MITRKRARMSRLHLEDLPDELILKVFESLKTLELIYCSQVSKRLRRIRLETYGFFSSQALRLWVQLRESKPE